MCSNVSKYAILTAVLFIPLIVSAQSVSLQNDLPSKGTLFHNFGNNIVYSFTKSYGFFHVAATTSTYSLIKGGVDWQYYEFMRDNSFLQYTGFPSVVMGGLVPAAAPIYLYYKAKSDNNSKLMYTSYALGQSVLLSLLVSSSYKAITGRAGPDLFEDDGSRPDYSDDFKFGFLKRGVFDGWPSGHTTTAVAMATTLIKLYPENKFLKTGALIYAFIISAGVSANIHWLSDVVAGTLIGYSIGMSVGSSFKSLIDEEHSHNNVSVTLKPFGFNIAFSF